MCVSGTACKAHSFWVLSKETNRCLRIIFWLYIHCQRTRVSWPMSSALPASENPRPARACSEMPGRCRPFPMLYLTSRSAGRVQTFQVFQGPLSVNNPFKSHMGSKRSVLAKVKITRCSKCVRTPPSATCCPKRADGSTLVLSTIGWCTRCCSPRFVGGRARDRGASGVPSASAHHIGYRGSRIE